MILFEKIETVRGEVPLHLKAKYEKAWLEFIDRFSSPLNGAQLVNYAFKCMDKLTKTCMGNNKITCRSGCSHCCKQLICCTTIEMENILEHIKRLPRASRREKMKSMAKEATKFAAWYGSNCLGIPSDKHKLISEPIRSKYFGIPCIFLKGNICSIYGARPVICRTTKVVGDFCGKQIPLGQKREAKPIKFFYDQVITDIIKEEERRIYGELKVLPLRVWPLDKKFKKEFFR